MTDKLDEKAEKVSAPDTLVDALESIQNLLEESDSKLAVAQESVALASNKSKLSQSQPTIDENVQNTSDPEQMEIPVLDDIVIPSTAEKGIMEHEEIPTLYDIAATPESQAILSYLDKLEEKLEKTLIHSLRENLMSIETELQQSISSEVDKIRKQIKKDFS